MFTNRSLLTHPSLLTGPYNHPACHAALAILLAQGKGATLLTHDHPFAQNG